MLSGLVFLPLTLGIFAMSRVTPRLLERFGARPMLVTGTIGLAASFSWLAFVGAGDGTGSFWATIFGPMLLNGLSAGLVFMPVTATVLGGVWPEHGGSASGLLQTAQQLGGAIGLAVIASVYAAGAEPGQFMPGLTAAFLTSATFSRWAPWSRTIYFSSISLALNYKLVIQSFPCYWCDERG